MYYWSLIEVDSWKWNCLSLSKIFKIFNDKVWFKF